MFSKFRLTKKAETSQVSNKYLVVIILTIIVGLMVLYYFYRLRGRLLP